jgi:hypothetical protein
MPLPGTKPAETRRRRNAPIHEWIEVENVPFENAPPLPRQQPNDEKWPRATRRWWRYISSMPHCVLWSDADWQFAIDTAYVHAEFVRGNVRVATELRNREKVLGTTVDFRRDLRIRYVEPRVEAPESVSVLEDYRRRLGSSS